MSENKQIVSGLSALVFIVCLGVALTMYGCPKYNVWERGQAGKAELAQADYNKQIAVQTAHATMESAKLLAEAEVERAKGVAAANKIIGDSLKGNEDYLHYLWIHNLAEAENKGAEIIYVPTEANLPILEAARLMEKSAASPGK